MRKQCTQQCRLCAAVGYCIETCGKCTNFQLWTPIDTSAYQDADDPLLQDRLSNRVVQAGPPATLEAPRVSRTRRQFDQHGMTESGVYSFGWWLVLIDQTEFPSITEIRSRSGRQHHQTKIVIDHLLKQNYITENLTSTGRRWATQYVLTDKAKPIALDFIENHPDHKFDNSDILLENKKADEKQDEYSGPVHKVPEIKVPKPSIPEIKKTYIPPPDTTKKHIPEPSELKDVELDMNPDGSLSGVSLISPEPKLQGKQPDKIIFDELDEPVGFIDPLPDTTSKEPLEVVEKSASKPEFIDEASDIPPEAVNDANFSNPTPITIDVPLTRNDCKRKLAFAKADLARYKAQNQFRKGYIVPRWVVRKTDELHALEGEVAYYETLVEELPE